MQLWAIRNDDRYHRVFVAGLGSVIKVFTTEAGARADADDGDSNEVMLVDELLLNALFSHSAGTEDGFIGVCVDGQAMPWPDFEKFIAASARR